MEKSEQMNWNDSRKYSIVFTQRAGSTFLAHCLDSHIDIGCERGEPAHPLHPLSRLFPFATPTEKVLSILNRPGYKVNIARVNYRHIRNIEPGLIRSLDGVIHLTRENVLRNIISAYISTMGHKPNHSYYDVPNRKFNFSADTVKVECERYVQNVNETTAYLEALNDNIFSLTYEQITGDAETLFLMDDVSRELQEYLGVTNSILMTTLKRTNPQPMNDIIRNYKEIKEILSGTVFEKYLEA